MRKPGRPNGFLTRWTGLLALAFPACVLLPPLAPVAGEARPDDRPPGPPAAPVATAGESLDSEGPFIEGIVVDDRGDPIVGALLVGIPMAEPDAERFVGGYGRRSRWARSRGPLWEGRTAANGTFHVRAQDIPLPEMRTDLLRVHAEGHLLEVVPGTPEQWKRLEERRPVRGLRIVLERAAVLWGRVFGPDGAPVEGALVTLTDDPEGREVPRRLWSGPDGSFSMGGLSRAEFGWVRAVKWGGRSDAVCLSGRLSADAPLELEFRIPPYDRAWFESEGWSILTGTIVDPEGCPVAGAVLWTWPPEAPDAYRMTFRTGADGRFELALPPRGPDAAMGCSFGVEAPGFFPREIRPHGDQAILLRKGRPVEWGPVPLSRTTTLTGRVLDAEGHPVPEAVVELTEEVEGRYPKDRPDARRTWTDRSSRFRFLEVPEEARFAVAWRDSPWPSRRVSMYVPIGDAISPGEIRTLDIPLPPDREVALEVVLRGYRSGLHLYLDSMGLFPEPLPGDALRCTVEPGPHEFWVVDEEERVVGHALASIPSDATAWKVEIEVVPPPAEGETPEAGGK